ncbi:TPA: hypothetical protein N0F65_006263 [Lagenidium giganteum]|uniref:Protein farnesyltransferase/geranylgeranyltransferase type-1 subunit alpha n=1 Tax=Lagenidium giganteum TaxID=4803 RepID=A0AAV2Z6C9_9STRA|nr:TPA: hypothetical protein N0F65_006263 [Lagenidium giganteum]
MATKRATKGKVIEATQHEAVQQEVLRHYAKTVYFNGLWKSFLSKLAGLVVFMSMVMLQRMFNSPAGLNFPAGFEVLSILIALSTVLFIQRMLNPLLAFKIAFAFSLLQAVWYGHTLYSRYVRKQSLGGDLLQDQFAFGVFYFLICWVADRFINTPFWLAQAQQLTTPDMTMRYRDDPAWADVEKIPQDDGPNPIVRLAYSANFTDVMDCFRGVLRTSEYSERTLKLSKDVINANPANYTAWYFRRRVLEALNANLYEELEYTEQMAIEHPKNYQIWHHRREIAQALQDGSAEKQFCKRAIEEDSKNYHAWAHRQWAIRRFKLWDGELDFVDEMLASDVRNNSAWNQRWFVIKHTTELDESVRERELNYAFEKIDLAAHNESPWNYVRGLVRGQEQRWSALVKDKCQAIYDQHPDCIHAAALLVDLLSKEATPATLATANEIIDKLMNETDRVRCAYWQFRKSGLARVTPTS